MSCNRLAVAIVIATMVSFAPGANAQSVQDAAGYVYPLLVEDDAGDHAGIVGLPNAANPENDLLSVEATDDATHMVVRVEVATFEFGVAGSGPATVTLQITGPEGEDWEASVSYESGGENPTVADFDPADGDDDALIPGVVVELDTENNLIYFFLPVADTGMGLGDSFTFDSVNSGRGVGAEGNTITNGNRDDIEVAGVSYELGLNFEPFVPEPTAQTFYADVEGDSFLQEFILKNVTVDTYVYNWSQQLQDITIGYEAAGTNGSVNLSIVDGAGAVVLQNLLGVEQRDEVTHRNATEGTWVVSIQFRNFTGDFSLQIDEAPALEGQEPGEDQGDGGNETSDDGNATGGNPFPNMPAEDTPGLPLVMVLAMVSSALVLRRRK